MIHEDDDEEEEEEYATPLVEGKAYHSRGRKEEEKGKRGSMPLPFGPNSHHKF